MSMNLANLLNDGKLKKSFMVATLVSTIIGTFTTSMTLHDKVQDKRFQAKQKNLDEGQDKKIQNLQEQVEKLQNGQNGSNGSERSRSESRSQRPKPRRRSTGDDGDSDDFDRQARRSRALIAREFEDNVNRLGQRYAQGDVISENKLQAQIIALQQTVIDVLQDALMSGRTLSKADIRRLVAAQDRARDGSLDVLRDQYERMIQTSGRRETLFIEDQQSGPPARQLTLPPPNIDSPMDGSFSPLRRVRTLPAGSGASSDPQVLYCSYSYDLQRNFRKGLHPAFSPTGTQRCPSCDVRIPVTADKIWVVETGAGSFTVDSRLVIKSHTTQGDFACVLCYNDRERDADCICSTAEALVRHVGRVHTQEEFEREVDVYRS